MITLFQNVINLKLELCFNLFNSSHNQYQKFKFFNVYCNEAKWIWSRKFFFFLFFLFCLLFLFAFLLGYNYVSFHFKPHGDWAIVSRVIKIWMIAKTIKDKEIICFVWLYLWINIYEFLLICVVISQLCQKNSECFNLLN